LPLPDTVAVQVAVCPSTMEEGEATTETEETVFPWPFTFTELEPDFFLSCFEVAVTVSIPFIGALPGAV
jgi:hypothetical protein